MRPYIAKLTSRGRVTIPKELRDELGIGNEGRLLLSVESGRMILAPLKSRPLSELYGSLPATKRYPSHEKIREEVRARLGKRGNEQ